MVILFKEAAAIPLIGQACVKTAVFYSEKMAKNVIFIMGQCE
jgi:Na+-transporting methylmalonyl-CoA/oxaloacetate decarboxylase beta subunit